MVAAEPTFGEVLSGRIVITLTIQRSRANGVAWQRPDLSKKNMQNGAPIGDLIVRSLKYRLPNVLLGYIRADIFSIVSGVGC
jgi:hypothetical protein